MPDAQNIKALNLRTNFSWTLAGNVIYGASQFGILVLLARLGTPEIVGKFALGLAIGAPVYMFTNLQLRAVQATDARRTHPHPHYQYLRVATTVLALALISLIIWASGYGGETALVIGVIAISKAVESFSDVEYGLMQQRERLDYMAHSFILRGTLGLAAVGIVFYLTQNLAGSVGAMTLAWLLVYLLHDRPRRKLLTKNEQQVAAADIRPRVILGLALTALPLGLSMMLISLNTSIPKYLIEYYLSERELGIFAALAYLVTAGGLIINALGQSATPRLSQLYFENKKNGYVNLLFKLCSVAFISGFTGFILVFFFGKEILNLIYGKEYGEENLIFIWLMIYGIIAFLSSIIGYSITAARLFTIQLYSNGITTLIILVLCAILISTYGLFGAVLAIIISQSFKLIISLSILFYAINKMNEKKIF